MEQNIGRISGVKLSSQKKRREIRALRKQLDQCKSDKSVNSIDNMIDFFGQSDQEEVKGEEPKPVNPWKDLPQ